MTYGCGYGCVTLAGAALILVTWYYYWLSETECVPGHARTQVNHASVLQHHALYGIFSGLT